MIEVENDYETVIYEDLYISIKIKWNFFSDYETRSRSNDKPSEQKINKVTISHETEKEQVLCTHTNRIYQNAPKQPPREKNWTIAFLLESPKSKYFQA